MEFRAVKIELLSPTVTNLWVKVHAAVFQKSSGKELFLTFDAAGTLLNALAISSGQTMTQYLVNGILMPRSDQFIMASDTRIQRLDL